MNRRLPSMIRLSRALRRRLDQTTSAPDAGMAMLMVIMFMILLLGLSLSIVSTIRAQPTAVFSSERSTKTVYAAQAGMQVALGQLRSIPGTGGYGNTAKLPCSVSGTVDGSTSSSSYSTTISYFLLNPTGHTSDATWLASNALTCTPLAGTTVTPNYALLQSTGNAAHIAGLADAVGRRKVIAVYAFNVSNVNIPGGRIWDLSKTYCLSAASATVGATVQFLTAAQCDTAGAVRTSWIYDTDWKLKLASSTVSGSPLCITDPMTAADPRQATLQLCVTGAASYTQIWSWTGDYSWRGQKSPISAGNSSTCLAAMATPLASGVNLAVKSTSCNAQFSPSSAVGAGAASYSTHQIVNYQEFGRCADVTNTVIGSAFMISYPCKQDPTGGGALEWNHKWYYTEPATGTSLSAQQHISVTTGGTNYCLSTPATGASPAYVTFVVCDTTNTVASQNWVRVGVAADYASSYLFLDRYNRCLAVDPTDTYNTWSKLIVTSCTGALTQKWNAPAGSTQSTFGFYKEVSP